MSARTPVIGAGEQAERPEPRRPPAERTVWLDYATGRGVDEDGRTVEPVLGGRRKKPKLVDLLETARHHHARRLVLCGAVPLLAGDWLLPDERTTARGESHTPGWEDEGHYLDDPPQGRFLHTETKAKLAVCLAREWFPEADPAEALDPRQARFCWTTLTWVVQQAIQRDWPLYRLPGLTILNIWKLRAPASYAMDRLDLDIGREIQANEPQHRVEHYLAPGRCDCGDCPPLIGAGQLVDGAAGAGQIGGFAYADGRFFFHGAPPKELGAAPATRLNGEDATRLFTVDPYWPARYRVDVRVPDWWETLGLLPVKRDSGSEDGGGSGSRGWHWPNRPGARFTTWADARELRLASEWGWAFTITEGVRLTKTNSLSFLSNTISRMLELTDELTFDGKPASPRVKQIIGGAIRHMYRVGIGSFSRRARLTTHFAVRISDVPAHAVGPADRANGGFIYRVPTAAQVTDSETWHPEIAARVWATSRVAVLDTPTAKLTRGPRTGQNRFGALEIPPEQLIGITGDAVYTTTPQDWTLPVAAGGGDDGRTGRIRIKGWLPGPIAAPPDIAARQKLSRQAELRGWADLLP